MASRKFPVRDDNADTQSDYSVLWESHGVLLCELPSKLRGVMVIINESWILIPKRLKNNYTTTNTKNYLSKGLGSSPNRDLTFFKKIECYKSCVRVYLKW